MSQSRLRTSITIPLLTLVQASVVGGICLLAAVVWGVPPREQVVLFKNGRIMQGAVTPHAAGYIVEQPTGKVVVPEESVRFVADSLVDAYRKQRENVLNPNADFHIGLAEWCLTYRLPHEARHELTTALNKDPDNAAARKMLQRVEESLRPQAPQIAPVPRGADGFAVPKVESLGGLSRETALLFTTRIQPTLQNKCGGGNCHGSRTTTAFQLTSIRVDQGGGRIASERNLAQVLAQIDLENWSQSPLLIEPKGNHGGLPGSVFSGQGAALQQKLISDWVAAVAEEKSAEAVALSQRPSATRKASGPANPRGLPTLLTPQPAPESPAPVSGDFVTDPSVVPASGSVDSRPSEEPGPSLPLRPVDAFDPDEFNRTYVANPTDRGGTVSSPQQGDQP